MQPLDVSINKPFKAAFRDCWTSWIMDTPPIWTAQGNRQRPSYQTIVDMVESSLNTINRVPLITNAFKTCGIVINDFINFDYLNYPLREILNPDFANISHETILALQNVFYSSPEDFQANLSFYLDFVNFEGSFSFPKEKKNRRSLLNTSHVNRQ